MTGYQTTGSPQEPSRADQDAWDRAFDAAYDYADAQGLELSQLGMDDLVRELLADHEHPAWEAFYAEERRVREAKEAALAALAERQRQIMAEAISAFAPKEKAA